MVFALFAGCAPRSEVIRVELTATLAAAPTRESGVHPHGQGLARLHAQRGGFPALPSLSTATPVPENTASAVAQIRGNIGNVIADIFLAEGATVSGLMKTAVGEAYARAGYRVAEGASAPTDVAVDVEVLDFWAHNVVASMIFRFTGVISTESPRTSRALPPRAW